MKYMVFIITLLSIMLIANLSFAGEETFKCGACHETADNILPAKHEKINKFDECITCHQDGKAGKLSDKLHNSHFSKLGLEAGTCSSCHQEAEAGVIRISYLNDNSIDISAGLQAFQSYNHHGTLVNSHKNAGLACKDCHETYDFDEIDNMTPKCKNCHGDYPEVAKRTLHSAYKTNPHKSHYPTLECTKCHSMHGEFRDFCSQKCHKWGFEWKQKITK